MYLGSIILLLFPHQDAATCAGGMEPANTLLAIRKQLLNPWASLHGTFCGEATAD